MVRRKRKKIGDQSKRTVILRKRIKKKPLLNIFPQNTTINEVKDEVNPVKSYSGGRDGRCMILHILMTK